MIGTYAAVTYCCFKTLALAVPHSCLVSSGCLLEEQNCDCVEHLQHALKLADGLKAEDVAVLAQAVQVCSPRRQPRRHKVAALLLPRLECLYHLQETASLNPQLAASLPLAGRCSGSRQLWPGVHLRWQGRLRKPIAKERIPPSLFAAACVASPGPASSS